MPSPIVAASSRLTMPTRAWPGDSEPITSWPSAFSLTRAMKSRTTGRATSASSRAMRTSRSMSVTLDSVMRAWPRISLTRRDSFSESDEAMGAWGSGARGGDSRQRSAQVGAGERLNCSHDSSQWLRVDPCPCVARRHWLPGPGRLARLRRPHAAAWCCCWAGCCTRWCWPSAWLVRRRISALRRPCRSPPGWSARCMRSSRHFYPQLRLRRVLCRAGGRGGVAAAAVSRRAAAPGGLGLVAAALGAGHRVLWPVRRGRGPCLDDGARRGPHPPGRRPGQRHAAADAGAADVPLRRRPVSCC